MLEEPTSSGAGATPVTGSPATGTASSGATPQPKPATTLEEALARIAELEHTYSNTKEELERHRKNAGRFKELEAADAQRQQAAMSDLEKAQKQAQAAEKQIQQYKEQLVLAKVVNAAHAKGIIDPDLAALAVKGMLEYDDDGMPTNVDKTLDELLKSKPYLKAAEPANVAQPARTNQPPQLPPMNNPAGRSQITPPTAPLKPGQRPALDALFKRE